MVRKNGDGRCPEVPEEQKQMFNLLNFSTSAQEIEWKMVKYDSTTSVFDLPDLLNLFAIY